MTLTKIQSNTSWRHQAATRHDEQGQDLREGLRCSPPVLYRAPDGSVTINANPGDESLTVLRLAVSSGSMSPPIPAPFELPALIRLMGSEANVDYRGEVTGLGLDYEAVARALHELCRDHSVNASFHLERPNVAELLGTRRTGARPESEL